MRRIPAVFRLRLSRCTIRHAAFLLPLAGVCAAGVTAAEWRVPSKAVAPAGRLHLQVPEGFTIERVADPDLLSYPMFATLAGEGRLFVFESTGPNTMTTAEMLADPSYHVRLLEDTNLDGTYDRSRIFADRIPFPMGGALVGEDLFVAAAPDLLRLRDTTGDGVADEREVVLTGWRLNVNGAAMGGPFMGPDGWLYITDARRGFEIRRKEGDVVSGKGARIWRVRPDGTGLEWISGGGFDNAVEIAFMPSGETLGTMTYFLDPRDGLRDAIMHWVEGGVYPKPHQVIEDDRLTLTGPLMPPMTKLARVAHSGLMRYRGQALGPEYHGNLFTAQFNTGRVMRHIVTPDGATYRTEDEPFMTSNSADSHPTDVLEDADGSLLVVETGGWFIQGCPLSRVAKPEVRGGLYRIRRSDAPAVADPWGRTLGLETAAPTTLVEWLDDPRPAVRDRVIERLVALGEASVAPLAAYRSRARTKEGERTKEGATLVAPDSAASGEDATSIAPGATERPNGRPALLRDRDAETRAATVFALHRIGTPAAAGAVRQALGDPHATVRTAAVRAVGLARDTEAVAALERMVKGDVAQVRRQAATSLGRIGADTSTAALIAAAAVPGDRFVQHAITHSLITLGRTAPLVEALGHASPDVRRTALVALDQSRPSPLRREHLAQFLAPEATDLWDTGVWVASHHPEWSDLVVTFLAARLDAAPGSSPTTDIRDLMVTFCRDSAVQQLVATRLGAPATSTTRRLQLLDVMQECPSRELPARWVSQLGAQLRAGSRQVRSRVLRLVEARHVAALEPQLQAIVHDTTAPIAFRLDSLSSLVVGGRALDAIELRLVTEYLHARHEAPLRQLAARILAQASLTEEQLVMLARDHVASTDVFLLPRLVEAFAGSSSAAAGHALVAALLVFPDRLDSLAEDDLRALLSGFPSEVQPDGMRLLAAVRDRQAERLSRLQAVEAKLGRGNIDTGRRLFFGKSLCSTCHAVGSQGSRFGPDLTTIGDIRSRHDIIEAILFPSASFAREYDTYRVRTATTTHTGVLEQQLTDAVVVGLAPDAAVRVPRTDIVAIEPVSVSMMPPGLEHRLTEAELADLVAFLESLPDPIERPSRERR